MSNASGKQPRFLHSFTLAQAVSRLVSHTSPYETTPLRAATAFVAGAFFGAFLFSCLIEFAVPDIAPFERIARIFAAALAGTGIYAVFLAIALPFWTVLHRIGRRSWIDATALGFLLTLAFIVLTEIEEWSERNEAQRAATVSFAVESAVVGALVGFLIWRLAYVRRKP